MSKLQDWWNSIDPNTVRKLIKIPYAILFLVLITPSIIWLSIPNNYESKNDWLQDFAWIFPLTIIGAGFITTVVWIVFNYIRDTKK